jgi:ribosomal-protein-alanine N-acetyltransferase
MNILLRKFKCTDLKKILEIEKASFPDPWSREGFLYNYRRNPSGFIVAVKEGEVVGYAVARIEASFEMRRVRIYRRCHLSNLAVEPTFRCRGIGSSLLAETIRHAQSKGAREVYLEVRAKNISARDFYEKKGFVVKECRKGYYGDDDALIMACL